MLFFNLKISEFVYDFDYSLKLQLFNTLFLLLKKPAFVFNSKFLRSSKVNKHEEFKINESRKK